MGALTSTLTFRLNNLVSGPAQKIGRDLKRLHADARHAAGPAGLGGFMAGGLGINMAGLAAGAAAYTGGVLVKDSVMRFAAVDRAMTRVGITADATSQQIGRAYRDMGQVADDVALSFDEVKSGAEALVAQGRSLPDAMAFLPSVARAAQASGAAVVDLARSAGAMSTSLKVSSSEMQAAFDALAAGGKFGQFELKDFADYLPRIAASASKLGFAGVDGVKRIAAIAQVVRDVSGTSEQAAVGMIDAFEKLLSPTVEKAFQKKGVNIEKVLRSAAKRGETGFEAVIDVLDKMTSKMDDVGREKFISSIFTEADSRRAVSAMLKHRDKFVAAMKTMATSAGTVDRDLKKVLSGPQADIDRLAKSWDELITKLGRNVTVGANLDGAGGNYAQLMLKAFNEVLDDIYNSDDSMGSMPRRLGEKFAEYMKSEAEALLDPNIRNDRSARRGAGVIARRYDPKRENSTGDRYAALQHNRLVDYEQKRRREALAEAEREYEVRRQAFEQRRAEMGPIGRDNAERAWADLSAALKAKIDAARAHLEALPIERVPVSPVRGGKQRRDNYSFDGGVIPLPPEKPAVIPPRADHARQAGAPSQPPPLPRAKPIEVIERLVSPERRVSTKPVTGKEAEQFPALSQPVHAIGDDGSRLAREIDAVGAKARVLDGQMRHIFDPAEFSSAGAQAMQSLAAGIAAGKGQALAEIRSLRAEMQSILAAPLRVQVQASGSVSGAGRPFAPAPAELPSRTAMHARRGLLSDIPSYS